MDNDPYLQLMNEMKSIRKEMKELNDKLDSHISFIEGVYRGLRHPLDKVKGWFSWYAYWQIVVTVI